MLNGNAADTFFKQISSMWIEPELRLRKETNRLQDDFSLYQCLIKLPLDSKPVVEFNEEIRWHAFVKCSEQRKITMDNPIYLHDIDSIETVEPPEINGMRVAFVYLFWDGNFYRIVFDFSPNVPENVISTEKKEDWVLGKYIAESLQAIIVERTIHRHNEVQGLLSKVGLWAAPALLPYPLSEIAIHLKEKRPDKAIELLKERCTPNFIESLSQKWWDIEQFKIRKALVLDAITAHKEHKYGLSIHALLPQLEGIITDWIYSQIPKEEVPWRQESKTKKFREIITEGLPSTYIPHSNLLYLCIF